MLNALEQIIEYETNGFKCPFLDKLPEMQVKEEKKEEDPNAIAFEKFTHLVADHFLADHGKYDII